jgi:predicted cupin superfamily sugar epimerase
MRLSPHQVIDLLNLKAHPTCGFARETYRSDLQISGWELPSEFRSGRPLGGVLYFMVTAQAPVHLHRIRSDQMYHHYLGDPLEVLLLYPGGGNEVRVVGPDLAAGMRPQLLIPGGTFHAGRVPPGAGYSLLGTSVWARPEPADIEAGNAAELMASYPAARAAITAFTH